MRRAEQHVLGIPTALFSLSLLLCLSACNNRAKAPSGSSNVPPKLATLPIVLSPQEMDNWCWAASGKMIMQYLGVAVEQCTEVNDYLRHSDCCPSPARADGCDSGGWPEFGKHGITFLETNESALSFQELKNQIGNRKMPIAFSWKWIGGGGHMMVAVGYNELSAAPLVEVDNPWAPNIGSHTFITYDEYVEAANDHTHWNDFYNFIRKPQ